MDIGRFNPCRAAKDAALDDFECFAVERCVDIAFDDQSRAVADLAFELDARADAHFATLRTGRRKTIAVARIPSQRRDVVQGPHGKRRWFVIGVGH